MGVAFFSTVPQQADALFGLTCIPRLDNCMCTYIFPCPVIDINTNVSTSILLEGLKKQTKDQALLTTEATKMNGAVSCESSGSLPGLNSIGIDINSIIQSKIPKLNIGNLEIPGLDSLQSQLQDLNIDTSKLQDVLSGNISPEKFLEIAQQSGIEIDALSDIGLNLGTLQDLASGNIDSLLATGMDRLENELAKNGINADLIQDLASGKITTETFIATANEAGISIPKLGDMGLSLDTLNSLSSGTTSGMGLAGLDTLTSQTSRINPSTKMLQDMLTGTQKSSKLISMANEAGLGPMTLKSMGISSSTLNSIASDTMNPQQMLEFSKALNLKPKALEALGISPELITNISTGAAPVNSVANIANGSGLTTSDLLDLGLDTASLNSMKANGASGLMSTLQNAGLGNPMLDALGIDAGMLGKIASGDLPASAINELMAGTGIDPKSIVIPGMDGPLTAFGSLTDDLGSPLSSLNNHLSTVGSDITQMVNLPISSIPGLGGALGNKCGTNVDIDMSAGGGLGDGNQTGGTDTGTATDGAEAPQDTQTGTQDPQTGATGATGTSLSGVGTSGAICEPNRPLISATVAPHDLTYDIANLDFALSGNGDIMEHREAISDAQSETNRMYATAISRSIVMRPLFVEALDSMEDIQSQIDAVSQAGTLEQAWRLNSSIKLHLMTAKAELTSFKSFYATLLAAPNIRPNVFSPIPILPHNSEWENQIQETERKEVEKFKDTSELALQASLKYNDFSYQAREALNSHERAKDYNEIVKTLPGLVETINTHEDQKENLYFMEQQVKSGLANMYTDPDAAWEILKADLDANSGDYNDSNKWDAGAARGDAISNMLTEQKASTRYGKRILVKAATEDDSAIYSRGSMPDNYPEVNARLVEGDELRLQDRGSSFSSGIQTYFATKRREEDWSVRRRGGLNGTTPMTGTFWNEMINNEPSCLTGPIATTPNNLLKRPELFDLSPNCNHLIWENGDAEDYIPASNLGGADATLWRSKTIMNTTLLGAGYGVDSTQLGEAVQQKARDAIEFSKSNNVEENLRSVDYVPAANNTVALENMLTQIIQDTDLNDVIEIPLIKP